MVRKNISILDKNLQYINITSAVLNTTFSQVLTDIIEYVLDNDLERDIWEDWDELYSNFEKTMKESFGEDEGDLEEGEEGDLEEGEEGDLEEGEEGDLEEGED